MRSAWFAGLVGVLLAVPALAGSIRGQYLESRNANVYAGSCFVNSEIGLVGDAAIMAWKVNEGTYNGQRLDGLAVVAVVMGDRTFGIGEPVHSRTLFVVDQRATEGQAKALVSMARALAGDTIQKVVGTKRAAIRFELGQGPEAGYALLDAGVARIRTRRMYPSDATCSHARMAYPTLAEVVGEQPVYTLQMRYSGREFNEKFTHRDLCGAVIGKFSL